jgi:branched-chain amino acid transport system permease protein
VAWAFSGPTRYLSLATGAFFRAAPTPPRWCWGGCVAAPGAGRRGGGGGVLALLVGTARACGCARPYFAVFTFGLAELAKHTLIWFETSITGTVGRLLLSPPGPVAMYYTVLAIAALAVTTAVALPRSRWGVALIGIGADEERAETLGIDTTRVKIGVFALSAAFMGAIGGAMAPRWTYLDPQVFNPLVSFQTVIMALLGGPATVAGPILGAVFLGLLSEILLVKFRYLYMLTLGLVLIVVVLVLPGGLSGLARRRRPACGSARATL